MKTREQYDVGVIVGRFQVPELHQAHRDLISFVVSQHDKTIVFLGLSPLKGTMENPLDFEARKQMLLAEFPTLNVLYIPDMGSDVLWSGRLDEMLEHLLTPQQTAVLYGGRESFIDRYHGRFPTRELEQDTYVSGSEIRASVQRKSVKASADFRAGVIWAVSNRFPTAFTTVDVALWNKDRSKLLLVRKPNEPLHRFVGGFSTPASNCFEADAIREVDEELHLKISEPRYIASFHVDDWRYRGEVDQIKTLLFEAEVLHGSPRPDDDLQGGVATWFAADAVKPDDVMPSHRNLLAAALASATRLERLANSLS